MDKIWWERVPNALSFITDITNALINEESIIIQYSKDLPWRESFVEHIKDNVMENNYTKSFEQFSGKTEPGSFLLRKFFKEEKRTEYRPSKGYEAFFAENDDTVMHSRYIWVRTDPTEDLKAWQDLASGYLSKRDKSKERAAFIFEFEGNSKIQKRKGIRLFSYDDYISEYDRTLFTALAASEVNERIEIKSYLASLLATVVENDIELSAECVANYKDVLGSPMEAIRNIADSCERSDGTPFRFDKTASEIDHAVWRAQIRVIYPLIEEYRERFIEQHSREMREYLPIEDAFKEEINDPEDVEIGMLLNMSFNGMVQLDTPKYEELKLFKKSRDKLSHLNCLTMDEVRVICSNYNA